MKVRELIELLEDSLLDAEVMTATGWPVVAVAETKSWLTGEQKTVVELVLGRSLS